MSMRIAPRASTIVLLWRGNSQPSRTDCAESENAPLMPETVSEAASWVALCRLALAQRERAHLTLEELQ